MDIYLYGSWEYVYVEEQLLKSLSNFSDLFDLGKELGRGASGSVHICTSKRHGTSYALKTFIPSPNDTGYTSPFTMENIALSELSWDSNLHVPRYYDSLVINGKYCVLMELIPGKTLSKIAASSLSELQLLHIASRILQAIIYMLLARTCLCINKSIFHLIYYNHLFYVFLFS